nr:reverse transcriptase [Tanacetum cinerariifolium]GEW03615.1 reverse transcriptase [Tanacetum cinerariifolium]GEW03640.1 reverse transcriptase [Tanacetum cinerariifolium]
MGCKWNIGDGRTVNVWEDFWLADHKKLGSKPHNTDVSYVRDLLNNEGNDWNHDLLTSLFPPDIANKVACCFLLALETSQELVQIYSDEALRLFHAVWKAKARGLNITTSSCAHCGDLGEDVVHVLFKCSKAKDVWDRCSFGKLYVTPGAITIGDFCRITPMQTRRMAPEGLTRHKLHLSVYGRSHKLASFKFNCDPAWQKESGKVGLGFVAPNCNGEVLISGAKSECYANSPLEAEAKAIWWATIHARSRGYSNVVFESDSLSLVTALRNQSIPLQIATLFSDILSNSRSFNICKWSFTRRGVNKVAHSIASWALGCTNTVIIEGDVLNCASVLAVKDVISSAC